MIREAARKIAAQAPPLSNAQICKLCALLGLDKPVTGSK